MSDNMAPTQSPRQPLLSGNLRSRIISGAILAGLAYAIAWTGPGAFALLILAIAVVLSWEWGRMVRGVSTDLAFYVHAACLAVAIALTVFGYAALSLAVIVTGSIILVPLVFGSGAVLSALGMFYVGLPAVALLWLRMSEPYGFAAILFLFAVVWSSDIAAYASGRLIGGPKLWPRVSPNKTWAGLMGALAAGSAAGAIAAALVAAPLLRLVLIGLALSFVAQAGDLAESALKRVFGRKDASDLIPGHGGFMDRMDSIVAAAVAAALLALALDPRTPARALLFGV